MRFMKRNVCKWVCEEPYFPLHPHSSLSLIPDVSPCPPTMKEDYFFIDSSKDMNPFLSPLSTNGDMLSFGKVSDI